MHNVSSGAGHFIARAVLAAAGVLLYNTAMPVKKNKRTHNSFYKLLAMAAALCIAAGTAAVAFALAPAAPRPLDQMERMELEAQLDGRYRRRAALLSALPYRLSESSTGALEIWSRAAIIADVNTGNILYEKNADQSIPPASMTKLFVMAVTEFEIASGRISLEDKVPLPEESWAVNLPPDSSLMYLQEGQRPTLRELMLGLSVNSGNDAAIAVAVHTAGSVKEFVGRMNRLARDLGLEHTRFVEPSGYSEENVTTARDFAKFCAWYIRNFEQSLAAFHAQRTFTWSGITRANTNKLLDALAGCDGLKTGYITESGYNICVTAERGGHRFVSVTMGGPGNNAAEGDRTRVHDGTALMEWAFANFAVHTETNSDFHRAVKVFGSRERSVYAVPAYSGTFSVPKGAQITESIVLPDALSFDDMAVAQGLPPSAKADIPEGTPIGKIVYSSPEGTMQEVPLVTERALSRNGAAMHLMDRIIWHIIK